jgi:predicted nucleotidyltransferase
MAPVDERQLREIAARHGIRLIVQFGSTVAGSTHPRSDVDLGVLLAEPPGSLRQLAELRADLQALVPDREVDLAVLNRADPLFLKKVIERCRLVHGTPGDLHALWMVRVAPPPGPPPVRQRGERLQREVRDQDLVVIPAEREWIIVDVPQLRIVSEALWAARARAP